MEEIKRQREAGVTMRTVRGTSRRNSNSQSDSDSRSLSSERTGDSPDDGRLSEAHLAAIEVASKADRERNRTFSGGDEWELVEVEENVAGPAAFYSPQSVGAGQHTTVLSTPYLVAARAVRRQPPHQLLSGLLKIRSRKTLGASWKAYWFVLDTNGILAYFKSAVYDESRGTHTSGQQPEFAINLAACTRLELHASDKDNGALSSTRQPKRYSTGTAVATGSPMFAEADGTAPFTLTFPSRSLSLQADTCTATNEWITQLCIAGMLCRACGRSCFGDHVSSNSDDFAVAVPVVGHVYHDECFGCCCCPPPSHKRGTSTDFQPKASNNSDQSTGFLQTNSLSTEAYLILDRLYCDTVSLIFSLR